MRKGNRGHVGLTRQGSSLVDLSTFPEGQKTHRQFSGNSKVCVESYPQVYPQVVDKVVHNLSTSPLVIHRGREIVSLSGNPHLILR